MDRGHRIGRGPAAVPHHPRQVRREEQQGHRRGDRHAAAHARVAPSPFPRDEGQAHGQLHDGAVLGEQGQARESAERGPIAPSRVRPRQHAPQHPPVARNGPQLHGVVVEDHGPLHVVGDQRAQQQRQHRAPRTRQLARPHPDHGQRRSATQDARRIGQPGLRPGDAHQHPHDPARQRRMLVVAELEAPGPEELFHVVPRRAREEHGRGQRPQQGHRQQTGDDPGAQVVPVGGPGYPRGARDGCRGWTCVGREGHRLEDRRMAARPPVHCRQRTAPSCGAPSCETDGGAPSAARVAIPSVS